MIREGHIGRMKVYLAEMFPLSIRMMYAVLVYTSFSLILYRIHGVSVSTVSFHHIVGVWSVFAMLFILRLMDELKDVDIDRELFKERPLPSGRVLESDIKGALIAMIVLYLIPNMFVGKVFWIALAVLCYSLLMFRYFFIPGILRKYLLLNLATHNPIIPVSLLYIVMLFAEQYGIPFSQLEWKSILLVVAMFWSASFAWEISRKIRSGEEENTYVTYSQIFGRLGAVLVAGGAQTVGFAISGYLGIRLSFSWLYFLLMSLGYITTMVGHVRFAIRPNPTTSKLRPCAERYVITMILVHIVELGVLA